MSDEVRGEWKIVFATLLAFILIMVGVKTGMWIEAESSEELMKKNGAVTRCITITGEEHCELVCSSVPAIHEVRK